jgi:oligoribonuclease
VTLAMRAARAVHWPPPLMSCGGTRVVPGNSTKARRTEPEKSKARGPLDPSAAERYPLAPTMAPSSNPDTSSPDSGEEDVEDVRFVWIDLEMTGLNPDMDRILEIGVVVTGADLKPLGEMTRVIRQPEHVLERMSKVVRQMHTRNHLLEEVVESTVNLRQAEREAMSLIVQHCLPGQAFLCGNSVHHDWRFLVRYMPSLEQYLHYRQVDVSTVKVLVQAWAKNIAYDKQQSNHRALADVHASIAELRYYCEHAFRGDVGRMGMDPRRT